MVHNDINTELFMFSVFDKKQVKWIRKPYCSITELKSWLIEIALRSDDYENLQITPEELLDVKIKLSNQSNEDNEIFTIRQVYYGDMYESHANFLKDPENLKSYKDSLVSY